MTDVEHPDGHRPPASAVPPARSGGADDDRFAARAAQVLAQRAEALDAATRSRLRRARARAVAGAAARGRSPLAGLAWRPAAGVATAAMLVAVALPVLLDGGDAPAPASTEGGSLPVAPRTAGTMAPSPAGTMTPSPAGAARAAAPADDLELVLNVEHLEMMEDLEFFEWLAAQPEVI